MSSQPDSCPPILLPLDDTAPTEVERAILRRFLQEAGIEQEFPHPCHENNWRELVERHSPRGVRMKDWQEYWKLMDKILHILPHTMADVRELSHFIRVQRDACRSGSEPPPLLSVAQMSASCDSQAPHSLFHVLDSPSSLFGAPFPQKDFVWPESNVPLPRAVVCLCEDEIPEYECDKLHADEFHAWKLEDFVDTTPRSLIAKFQQIDKVVDAVWRLLVTGTDVLVHCTDGRGRTGTVIGGVLVRFGHKPKEVVRYLDDLSKQRGLLGWPERPWQAKILEMFVPEVHRTR